MEDKTSSFKPIKKGRFNAIDLLISVLIVGIIFVILFSSGAFSSQKEESVRLEYTVLIEGVNEDFLGKIKVGDMVYDSVTHESLGYVSKIDDKSRYTAYDYDKTREVLVAKEYPDRVNLKVTVSSDAEFVDLVGYNINGKRIAVGGALNLRFPNYIASVYCVDMNVVK
jgi:hypothetical protein